MKKLIMFIFLIMTISCKKEECVKCKIIGNWDVKESKLSIEDNEIGNQSSKTFEIEFNEDGTGTHINSIMTENKVYWTLSPDNLQLYVSINLENDTFYRTEQFEIITLLDDFLECQNEEFFVSGTSIITRQLKWELSK